MAARYQAKSEAHRARLDVGALDAVSVPAMSAADTPEAAANLWSLSAASMLEGFARRAISPVEVLEAVHERVESRASRTGALGATAWPRARAEAEESEARYRSGHGLGPLSGVPFAVKDILDTEGVATTYGSSVFADHVPARDAAAVAGVRRAGGVLVAKTFSHEFAWGITSVDPAGNGCRNPWDANRIAGGSSGGSAAAVADGLVPFAIGTDTAGSVRIPAAFCGCVGFKPGYGRIATDGVFPLAPSLDHVGALARTVADVERLTAAMAGSPLGGGRVPTSIAIWEPAAPAPAIARTLRTTAAALATAGVEVAPFDGPDVAEMMDVFRVVQGAEAVAVHRQRGLFPAQADRYGADVLTRLEFAAGLSAEEIRRARAARTRMRTAMLDALAGDVLVVSPVGGVTAPPVAEVIGGDAGGRGLRSRVLPFTVAQTLFALPACAVPMGWDEGGLPVALQVTGPPEADGRVLAAARLLERVRGREMGWPP
jgi:aspartyl-tRNA(Asn)/glutamyl-tRNA(Gln) amidotransferase subunit A